MALTMGVEVFTLLDLLRRAAAHKGLELYEGATRAYSKPIKTYVLDEKLLAVLAAQGIRRQARPDCGDEIFTLVDQNPQEKVPPGWAPSNSWNVKLLKGKEARFDLRVEVSVGFSVSRKKRGIVLMPQAYASLCSAADRLPSFRMFKALVDADADAPPVARELAASDGSIVVTWTDLGLGGIRTLAAAERMVAGGRVDLVSLSRPFIRDPFLVKHFREGTAAKSECISCNKCHSLRGIRCADLKKGK